MVLWGATQYPPNHFEHFPLPLNGFVEEGEEVEETCSWLELGSYLKKSRHCRVGGVLCRESDDFWET